MASTRPSFQLLGETPIEIARRYKEQGNVHFKAGEYAVALQLYTYALEKHPEVGYETATYHKNRAACLLKLGRHKEAEQDCTEALAVIPYDVKCFYRRCQAREGQGNLDEAYKDAVIASILDPEERAVASTIHRLQDTVSNKEQLKTEAEDIANLALERKRTNPVPEPEAPSRVNDTARTLQDAVFELSHPDNSQQLQDLLMRSGGDPEEAIGLKTAIDYMNYTVIPYGQSITILGIGAINYDPRNKKSGHLLKYRHFRSQWPDVFYECKDPRMDYEDDEDVSPAFVKYASKEEPDKILQ